MIEFPNRETWSEGCFSKCRTSRKAVFLPIPGSLENSFTASSSNVDGIVWFIVDIYLLQKYTLTCTLANSKE
jgi:hypothetical protein